MPTPETEALLAEALEETKGNIAELSRRLKYDKAGKEKLRRALRGETEKVDEALVRDVRAFLSSQKQVPDEQRSHGVHDIGGDPTNAPGPDMEVPKEHARETAFPSKGDHPQLSTIAVHPDYVVYGMDGLVRFRVSCMVEAAPPVQRRSGPEGGKA